VALREPDLPSQHIVTPREEPKDRSFWGALIGFLKPAGRTVLLGAMAVSAVPALGAAMPVDAPQAVVLQDTTRAEVDAAVVRLIKAGGDDGWVDGAGWGNELEEIDPLARAVYDYVNFVNPRGKTTGWGPSTRGDYMSGGLGVGYSFRPEHMTGNNQLGEDDLRIGAGWLAKAIEAGPATGSSLKFQDLDSIVVTGRAQGIWAADATDAEVYGAVYDAGDKLIEHIVTLNEAKEVATNNSTAIVTHAELLETLPEGSLERLIAERTVTNEHGGTFFAKEAWASAVHHRAEAETGKAGEVAMHYLLVVAKQAKEAELALNVEGLLP